MSDSMVVVAAAVVALAAAIRSTWSPCGHSMLSTMTPLGERSRGHRWGATAAWFVAGAVGGGLALGLVAASLAAGVSLADPSSTTVVTTAAVATAVALVLDARIGGVRAPGTRRQVNEAWLTAYRPWVYGLGFGLQIGCGVATYLMTAAVYLLVVLGALTGTPGVAVALGAGFGLVRGLAVFAGRRLTEPETLRAFHRHFDALEPASRVMTLAVETVVLAVALVALPLPTVLTVVLVAVSVVPLFLTAMRRTPMRDRGATLLGAAPAVPRHWVS